MLTLNSLLDRGEFSTCGDAIVEDDSSYCRPKLSNCIARFTGCGLGLAMASGILVVPGPKSR